jgi:hypothetical protein
MHQQMVHQQMHQKQPRRHQHHGAISCGNTYSCTADVAPAAAAALLLHYCCAIAALLLLPSLLLPPPQPQPLLKLQTHLEDAVLVPVGRVDGLHPLAGVAGEIVRRDVCATCVRHQLGTTLC